MQLFWLFCGAGLPAMVANDDAHSRDKHDTHEPIAQASSPHNSHSECMGF